MKKFISISPLQETRLTDYKVSNNPDLAYETTAFPIMNVLNAYAEKDEEVEIITVVTDYALSKNSYERLKAEVDHLAEKKGFKYKLKEIPNAYSDDIDTNLELFGNLIETADMTYGSKAMTLIMNMVINYGYRSKQDVTLGCIVYGKYDHEKKESVIYDITSFNYMDEIVRMLAKAGVKDPKENIKRMLK